jgi:hypothetical protein
MQLPHADRPLKLELSSRRAHTYKSLGTGTRTSFAAGLRSRTREAAAQEARRAHPL